MKRRGNVTVAEQITEYGKESSVVIDTETLTHDNALRVQVQRLRKVVRLKILTLFVITNCQNAPGGQSHLQRTEILRLVMGAGQS